MEPASHEERVAAGDESAWPAFLATIETAAVLERQLAPGAHGELLTTRQMAERLGVKPKTLLRHKRKGELRPAMQRGRLIRWKAAAQ